MLIDFGIEPEEFREQELLDWFKDIQLQQLTKMTEGIFAPWAFYKKDFQEIGGHDPLFAPQSKEDTDIFNRFQYEWNQVYSNMGWLCISYDM